MKVLADWEDYTALGSELRFLEGEGVANRVC